jgi:hypothetical protein
MKNLLLAAALLGMAACANTQKSAVGSAEAANAPTAACPSTCTGGECCAEKAGECTDMKASETGAVCPVTDKPASN